MLASRLLLSFALLCACRAVTPTPTPKKTAIPEPAPPKVAPVVEVSRTVLTPEQAFAKAMDATVLVTTAWGHGTGVFIDPSGFVLTNYHVVAAGKTEDFGITAMVTVSDRHADGSVSPGVRLTAVVHAIDEKRDLALLKVQGASREFPALKITTADPRPGTKVFALGNAGVGLGWALKRCSVNAIGTLDEQVNAIFQRQRDEVSAEERARTEEAIRKTAADAGRQIQTDCSILPGDSGGPLVDESTGEIVGLNVAIRTAMSQFVSLGSLAFHIHAKELRDFTKDLPAAPRTFLPDPWTSAGNLGALSDFDNNGEPDTLGFSGPCGENLTCQVAFGDIDESTFRGSKTLPTPSELQTSREFDAELAILKHARMPRKPQAFGLPVSDTLAFVDADNDGKFDRLIVADGETGGTRGYTMVDGVATRETTLDGTALVDLAAQFAKASLRPAVTRFVAALTTGMVELADPDKMHATHARVDDYTKDGKPDTLFIETRLDRRVLIDLDQKQLAAVVARRGKLSAAQQAKRELTNGEAVLLRTLRAGRLRGDVLVVVGEPTRVFYDTDDDGRMDLVLEGASIESGVALGAATIDVGGRLSPATQHLGRLLLRPALVGDKARVERLAQIFEAAFAGAPRASANDDASSFPPALPTRAAGVTPVGTFGDHVISVFDGESVVILADLDKNAFRGRNAKQTPLALVTAGKFDAELTLRFGNGVVWAYYDTDDDGRFDHVAIASSAEIKKVVKAYKLGKTSLQPDVAREGGALLDGKLVRGAAQQKVVGELSNVLFR